MAAKISSHLPEMKDLQPVSLQNTTAAPAPTFCATRQSDSGQVLTFSVNTSVLCFFFTVQGYQPSSPHPKY
jgi:hypothetical protein